jgi:ring-1,2-phenylacetyl-CoA epoxidase subunit PaaC
MKSPTCEPVVDALLEHVLRQGDRALILAQRLLQQITHAPEIEEDMALANLALDLLGQTRTLYTYAAEIEGLGHDEDHYAYWRDPHEFRNPELVEQPNTDFAHVILRQYLHDEYALSYWRSMTDSSDATLAALAAKSSKETAYHVRHSRGWVLRLGDGTDASNRRAQAAIDRLLPTADELFRRTPGDQTLVEARIAPDPVALLERWRAAVDATLTEATLTISHRCVAAVGPVRTEHGGDFEELVAEMQGLARAHPGATW